MLTNQILFFLFVHISLLIPGYVFITKLRFFNNHRGIELGVGYLCSIAFFALSAALTYVLDLNWIMPQGLFWTVFIGSIVLLVYQKLYKRLFRQWFPLLALLLMSGFSLAFINLSFNGNQSITPDPERRTDRNYDTLTVKVLNVSQNRAIDNYLPYRHAQFFANKSDPGKDAFVDDWGVHFFQRTPLMGAVTANYFVALNDTPPTKYTWSNDSSDPHRTYLKFQIIAIILNSLLVIPAFYLIKHFFRLKTALMAVLFIIPSSFFLYNSIYSWPKSLVAFFVLLSWLFILKKQFRYLILAGVASGMAFLAHDLALLYIGTSVILLLHQKRIRDSLIFGTITTIFILPWVLISAVLYKKPSSFILYPISVYDIPQAHEKQKIIQDFFNTSPLRLIQIRLESLYYLLSPYQLFHSEGTSAGRRLWGFGLYPLLGSLGMGLVIPTILGAVRKIKNIPFWILVLMPIVFSALVMGWPKGLGSLHFAEASVALLMGLGCYWLVNTRRVIWSILAYTLSTLYLLFFISYSYYNQIGEWFHRPGDIFCLGIISSIIIFCGIGVYFVRTERKIS